MKGIFVFAAVVFININVSIASDIFPQPFNCPSTIHIVEKIHWNVSPGFNIDAGHEVDTIVETWIQNGKWRFQVGGDKGNNTLLETYDGNNHEWFSVDSEEILHIVKEKKDIWLSRFSYITAPFLFLVSSEELADSMGVKGKRPLARVPGLLDVNNPDAWKKAVSKFEVLGEKTIEGYKCQLYNIKFDPYESSDSRFILPPGNKMEIAFAPDAGWLPIQLQWFDKNGAVILTSEITKSKEILVDGVKSFFPTEIHIKKFEDNGKLYQDNSITLTALEVGKPVPDESIFTLEPSIAKKIVDEKNGVTFDVK